MNREIKFRAWSKATEKMMDWDFIKSHGNLNKLLCLGHVEVMQFTGLTDKNGKEIYEGDILLNDVCKWEVVFNKGCFCHHKIGSKENATELALRSLVGGVVIGNIYETP